MKVVDLRPQLPPIRDQGLTRGTCLAFATTTSHEHRRGPVIVDLATEALFWAAKEVQGNRDDGTSFRVIYSALRDSGQPEENAWPYDPDLDIRDPAYGPPAGSYSAADCRRARLRRIDADLDAIKAELDDGNVVVVGIELWEEFELLRDGELDLPNSADRNGNMHAVALVGYDRDRERLLVRNSWGTDWGEDGYAWLPNDLVLFILCAAAIDQLH
jgi:C1A family cysteine protease